MSQNVEENVVKMRFDNKEFDNNVEESDSKLSKFKETLTSLPSEIELGLKSLVGNTSIFDILNFAEIHSGIDSIGDKIEGLLTPINFVVEEAIKGVQSVFNQMNVGGKGRAQNIEDAEFRLKGLKMDVDTFMEAANYAVKGTAYGLDEAAKVASQFGASGVTELEELKKALRAISGVAAMTNSSYSEIGRIFTFAASYGKITSRQLMMLSTRGINATATMAKAIGKSESEVRAMMSKGQVSFKMFYEAMDEAFGEHSKKANETFTGSMRNIKAALNRIGEGVWTPIMKNLIPIYNKIQNVFNQLKTSITDAGFYEEVKTVLADISYRIQRMLTYVTIAIEKSTLIKELVNAFKWLGDTVNKLATKDFVLYEYDMQRYFTTFGNVVYIMKTAVSLLYEAFDEILKPKLFKLWFNFQEIIAAFGQEFKFTDEQVEKLRATFTSWIKIVDTVPKAFENIFGEFDWRKLVQMIKDALSKLFDFITKLKASDDTISKVQRSFNGLVAVLDILKMLAISIFDFIKPVFGWLPNIADWILTITANIGDFLVNLRDSIDAGNVFGDIFDTISDKAGKVFDFLKGLGGSFIDIFFGEGEDSTENTFIDKIISFIGKVKELLKTLFGDISFSNLDFSPIQTFINNIANFGFSKAEANKVEDKANIFEVIIGAFTSIWEYIKKLLGIDKAIASATGDGESNVFTGPLEMLFGFLQGIFDWFKGFIEELAKNGYLAEAIASVLITVSLIIDALAHLLEVIIGGLTKLLFMLLSYGVIDRIVKIFEKSKNNDGEGGGGLFDFIGIFGIVSKFVDKLGGAVDEVSETIKKFRTGGLKGFILGEETFADQVVMVLVSFTALILAIMGSLFLLSTIPAEDLGKSVGALAAIMGIVAGLLIVMAVLTNLLSLRTEKLTSSPFLVIATAIDILVVGLIEIAIALKILDGVNANNLSKYVGTIAALLGIVTGILFAAVFAMSKISGINVESFTALGGTIVLLSLSLVLIAGAIFILSKSFNGDTKEIRKAAAIVTVVLVVIGVIFGALTKFAASTPGAMLALAGSLLIMMIGVCFLIGSLADAIRKIAKVDPESLNRATSIFTSLLTTVGTIVAILAVVGLIAGMAGELGVVGVLAVAALIVAFTLAIIAADAGIMIAGKVIDKFESMLKTLIETMDYFSDVNESKIEKANDNLMKFFIGIGKAAAAGLGHFAKNLTVSVLGSVVTKILSYVVEKVLPFLLQIPKLIFIPLVKSILESLTGLLEVIVTFYPKINNLLYYFIFENGAGGLLGNLLMWMDALWDIFVEWLRDRIPVVIPDVFELLVLLIKTINSALTENWDELDKELQLLIDNSLELLKKLLTGEKTWNDISNVIGSFVDHIVTAISENKEKIFNALKEIGAMMGKSLLAGLLDVIPEGKIKEYLLGELNIDPSDLTGTIVNPEVSGRRIDLNTKKHTNGLGINFSPTKILDSSKKDLDDMAPYKSNNQLHEQKISNNTYVDVNFTGDLNRFFDASYQYRSQQIKAGRIR